MYLETMVGVRMNEDKLASQMLSLWNLTTNCYLENHKDSLRGDLDFDAKALRNSIYGEGEGVRLRDFNQQMEKHVSSIDRVKHDLSTPFSLFVVGMGKMGKSTLINALLAGDYAEVDFLPKTWKIDVFHGGNKKQDMAVIHYRTGRHVEMNIVNAQNMLKKEEEKRHLSEKDVSNELRKRISAISNPGEKEEIKKELEKYMLYQSDVVEVHWPVPSNSLLKHFRIVDTPGLVQDLLGETKARSSEYLH